MATLLAKLQLPDAESIAAEGFRGVRVFRYDAFGTIWPATFMLTKPINEYRREGTVQARSIQADGRLVTLERPIWEGGWREMDAVLRAILERPPVERSARPVVSGGPPAVPPCLDPPVVIIEVVDEGHVRRWWPDTCGGDIAVEQAQRIAEVVAAAFPACGHFAIERYGRGLGRVRACLTVGGNDPVAAAEVMEILRPNIGGDTRVAYEAERQSKDVSLLGVGGQRASGRAEVLDAMKNGALGNRWLRVLRATGDASEVTVSAQLIEVDRTNNPDPYVLNMRWIKEADGEWRINAWSVEQR